MRTRPTECARAARSTPDVRRRRRWLALLTLATIAALCPRDLVGSTILYKTDAELIALSERVVHARVLDQRVERPAEAGGAIYTVTTLAVLEDFTGVADDTIEVWEIGGTFGQDVMVIGGEVRYTPGSDVLVCLGRGRFGLRSVAMGFSKFDISPTATALDGSTDGRLIRNMRETLVVGGAAPAAERSLSEFRALAAAVRGVASRPGIVAASLVPRDTVTSPFAILTFNNGLGARWKEPDSGGVVRVYRNTSAPSPLVSGNGDTEIQRALSAWTDPGGAAITLQHAGTVYSADPYAAVSSTGTILITFEDPQNEISNPTLAMGGGMATLGDGGVVNGTSFNRFVQGYIVFQEAASLPASFRETLNFGRVLEHEIGHTIGLGHSADAAAIMYASCCGASTPTPPALGSDDLAGVTFIYPAGAAPPACTYAISPSSASVGSAAASGVVTISTAAGCAWTASGASFAAVAPGSGTGPGTVTYSAAANPASTSRSVTLTIASRAFLLSQQGAVPPVVPPFGSLDTPLDNATGVTGSIPVTGWALDDVEVMSVKVYRDPVSPEAAGTLVYIGDATFVPGARPDVAAAYPTTPFNTRAGWGYLLLTNVLPNRGTGVFRLHLYATDREGNQRLLGSRTITCANSTATTPFGAIDTPAQGGVVTGTTYNTFGWVLSLGPRRADPPAGGTVRVVIDGVALGSPSGWTNRSDLTALFPASLYPGINTALGVYTFSTAGLANGLHTIAWSVVDNQGGASGIGSRYFSVTNPLMPDPASASAAAAGNPGDAVTASLEPTTISGRRGFALDAPLRRFRPDAAGLVTVQAEEIDRIELHLAPAATDVAGPFSYEGHLRTPAGLERLPVGSTLDAATGEFTWQPGAGFVGSYDLVFIRTAGRQPGLRQDVRLVLHAKASGHVGPQVVIDTPTRQQDVGQPFVLAGWAIDRDDEVGTGVDALHVWAYPLAGGDPVFVGAAAYGGVRPDVAALHGRRFAPSGYSLTVEGLPPGHYDLAVFAWSTAAGGFTRAKTVRVTVR